MAAAEKPKRSEKGESSDVFVPKAGRKRRRQDGDRVRSLVGTSRSRTRTELTSKIRLKRSLSPPEPPDSRTVQKPNKYKEEKLEWSE